MTMRLIVGMLAAVAASSAWAGVSVALGTPLGSVLGVVLGGVALGDVLPVVGSGVFLLAVASIGMGIYIARRKQKS